MVLAASFTITWFSFFMSFAAAGLVIGLVGVFTWGGNNSFNLTNWRWRPLLVIYVIAMFGAQVGLAAAEAGSNNKQVAAIRFHSIATRDLRNEHFRIAWLDDYTKTVGLLVGHSSCVLPGLSVAQVSSRHDPTIKWRPVLMHGNRQFGLEAEDVRALGRACSTH